MSAPEQETDRLKWELALAIALPPVPEQLPCSREYPRRTGV